jgi:hypothetical protein
LSPDMKTMIEAKTVGKILVFALVIAMSMFSDGRASDLTWSASGGATVSDNIYRDGRGLEENGTLLKQEIAGSVTERFGRGTFSLLAGGGWETIGSKEYTSDVIYRLELNASFPWLRNGRVEAAAKTSQETATPDPGDQDQLRSLVKQSEIGFLIANKTSTVSEWQAKITGTRENSANVDDLQTSGSLQYSRQLTDRHSFSFQGNLDEGKDDASDNSWRGSGAAITLKNSVEHVVNRSYDASWEEIVITDQAGGTNSSDKLGLRVRYRIEKTSGWSYEINLGVDSVKTELMDRVWDPGAGAAIKGPVSQVVEAEASADISTRIQDSRNIGEDRTRRGMAIAGLNWKASRLFTVIPQVQYQHEEIYVLGNQERIDEMFLVTLGTQWTPSRTWLVQFDAIFENIDSTDQTSELDENRLELTISTFFD